MSDKLLVPGIRSSRSTTHGLSATFRQNPLFPCKVADPQLDFFYTPMARAHAAENPRSRSKAVLIEEVTRGISQFQDILTAIDDFSQEGFPYRDAARAKAELQLREGVRRIFGERSQESQTYRNHKLRTSNRAEVAQSITVVKDLIKTLEDKKLDLQGLKPPPIEDSPAETSPATLPQVTLVPPTAQITMAPQPANTPPPMTLSVAMTTNLGMPVAPAAATPQSPPPILEPQMNAPSPVPPMPQSPISPAPFVPQANPPVTQPTPPPHEESATATPTPPRTNSPAPPIPALRDGNTALAEPTAAVTPTPSAAPPHSEIRPIPSVPTVDKSAIQSEEHSPAPVAPAHSPSVPNTPSTVQTMLDVRSIQPYSEEDPLQLIRKVCIRFHSVARHLRLRKEHRPTLEVEDDDDLQDLLCALLKVEFDEVGTDEWTPPYTGGAPRTTLFLNRDQIAVVVKKTRSGLTTKELADQVTADSAYYTNRDKCATLFCFIYDPEGRIGSPKQLETNLSSVSDHYTVEVLVAPK